jgi:hypothetical protein
MEGRRSIKSGGEGGGDTIDELRRVVFILDARL